MASMKQLAKDIVLELGLGSEWDHDFIGSEIGDSKDITEALRRMQTVMDDARRAQTLLMSIRPITGGLNV